jgi:hypothetical protein
VKIENASTVYLSTIVSRANSFIIFLESHVAFYALCTSSVPSRTNQLHEVITNQLNEVIPSSILGGSSFCSDAREN